MTHCLHVSSPGMIANQSNHTQLNNLINTSFASTQSAQSLNHILSKTWRAQTVGVSSTRKGTWLLTERAFFGGRQRGVSVSQSHQREEGQVLQFGGGAGNPLPSRQTLTLSTPVPRQSPAGTQKPSFVGLFLGLMSTSSGGAKRYAWMPFTSTSFT